MSSQTIKDRVRAFIDPNLLFPARYSDSDDIFALGLVREEFAMQLVNFLESAFQISVYSEDLQLENFRSVNIIEEFVLRKQRK
ncbi:MAG TPA: hypothetical protein PK299_11795 [Anaerolineales bacterium]|nr:hypothetical protein [Anaerolineales bacterium]